MVITLIALFLGLFLCLVWLLIAFVIYFMPIIIAYIRQHNNIFSIIILNIFLGWTFFGWLAALLWSLNSDVKSTQTEQC